MNEDRVIGNAKNVGGQVEEGFRDFNGWNGRQFPFPARTTPVGKPTTSTDFEMPSGHRTVRRRGGRLAARGAPAAAERQSPAGRAKVFRLTASGSRRGPKSAPAAAAIVTPRPVEPLG